MASAHICCIFASFWGDPANTDVSQDFNFSQIDHCKTIRLLTRSLMSLYMLYSFICGYPRVNKSLLFHKISKWQGEASIKWTVLLVIFLFDGGHRTFAMLARKWFYWVFVWLLPRWNAITRRRKQFWEDLVHDAQRQYSLNWDTDTLREYSNILLHYTYGLSILILYLSCERFLFLHNV